MTETTTPYISVSFPGAGIAMIQFDRPQKRNAFNQAMINDLVVILTQLDNKPEVRAIVITGGVDGPFCAGMDLKELISISTSDAHKRNFLKDFTDALARCSKPLIAAVVGYALGGGFEIALACDIIYAAEDSIFGLPEIKIGTIPGAGGTQRLALALGKHRAMEFILTGDSATGSHFFSLGVINKVFPSKEVLPAALALAGRLSTMSGPVVKAAKQAVLAAENSHLEAGMAQEKLLYYSTFSLDDCREGVGAFLGKRNPTFLHS